MLVLLLFCMRKNNSEISSFFCFVYVKTRRCTLLKSTKKKMKHFLKKVPTLLKKGFKNKLLYLCIYF